MDGESMSERLTGLQHRVQSACDWFGRHPALTFLLFTAVGIMQTTAQYFRVVFGPSEFRIDLTELWHPLAREVLSGEALYLGSTVDNKPPLFLILNTLIEFVGPYYPLFFIVLGTVNGTVAFLVYRHLATNDLPQIGVIGALFFLSALPLVNGTKINVRSFALLGVMVSIMIRNSILRGGAISVAGLFSQYAVFLIPVLMWDSYRDSNTRREWVIWSLKFIISGLIVLLMVFAVLALVWSPTSALSGFYWSFGFKLQPLPDTDPLRPGAVPPGAYFSCRWGPYLCNPLVWGGYLYYRASRLVYLLPFTAIGSLLALKSLHSGSWTVREQSLFAMGALSLPLLIRAFGQYWILPLPFIAILAAFGIAYFIRGNRPDFD